MADIRVGLIFRYAPLPLPASNFSSPTEKKIYSVAGRYDANDGGTYKVAGTVAIDASPDIPVKRKVRLFCVQSGRFVRQTWSDPVTGAYSFENIRQGPWLVVAHDYTNSYNAVVADNILGESM